MSAPRKYGIDRGKGKACTNVGFCSSETFKVFLPGQPPPSTPAPFCCSFSSLLGTHQLFFFHLWMIEIAAKLAAKYDVGREVEVRVRYGIAHPPFKWRLAIKETQQLTLLRFPSKQNIRHASGLKLLSRKISLSKSSNHH